MPQGWQEKRTIATLNGMLVIEQALVSQKLFDSLNDALEQGNIRLSEIFGREIPEPKIKVNRDVLQESLGYTCTQARLHYTLPDPIGLAGDEATLDLILSTLQEELKLPFKGRYAGRLGNFEIFNLAPWLDSPSPILTELNRDSPKDLYGPQTLEVCRTAQFSQNEHTVHLVCRTNDEVILDRLIRLPRGVTRHPISIQESLDSYELRLFETGDDSTVLFYEKSTLLKRIDLVLSPIGRSVSIQDELSDRAKSQDKDLGQKISGVASTSPQRSVVGGHLKGSWREFSQRMDDFVRQRNPEAGEDKWFPKDIKGEVGAITHLNRILDGGRIQGAVLVDPWFGAQSVARLAMRLSSTNIQLTIITSWTSIDPDTSSPVPSKENPTAELEAALNKARPFLNPKLIVSNLVDKGEQAFHDRYLLIYPHEGPAKVFLLSNSINKMAGKWPFCMSLLSPSAGIEVQRYIEGLVQGVDNARGRALVETFKWPSNEK